MQRSAPRSVNGPTIQQALLEQEPLARILKQPMALDPRFPPQFGGPETLQDDGVAAPVDCLGVATMLEHSVYQSGSVEDVAVETWRHVTEATQVTSVKEAVVSLPTAADADTLFGDFAQQWQKCDSESLQLPGGMLRLKGRVTDVHVAASIAAATVSIGFASPNAAPDTIQTGRALGVRDNCLVEVEVDFFNPPSWSLQRLSDMNATAVQVARGVMDNVSALS
jgi:PknH-like extracellular domain